ncbi:hypothetical protein BDV19DRAFT_390194 [Aspergillus venezuelensis]
MPTLQVSPPGCVDHQPVKTGPHNIAVITASASSQVQMEPQPPAQELQSPDSKQATNASHEVTTDRFMEPWVAGAPRTCHPRDKHQDDFQAPDLEPDFA